jgi:hypothetical protein
MTAEFATKLRLTAAVLGCDSHKALCARFRSVNPRTHFEIERAAKWLQGRATPRNRDVYDDWVKVLGIGRDSHWIMDCPVEAFLDEVSRHFGLDADTLRRRASLWEPALAADSGRSARESRHYLCGTFACYSWSWSPYHHGQIIRGGLRITPAVKRNATLLATYSEKLLGGPVRFFGEVVLAGRTLHMDLREPGQGPPLFFSLFLPGPPASVLCGMLSGATYVGHEPQPSATPFVAVRVPGDPETSNRYLDVSPDAFVADLTSLGLSLAAPDDVDARMRDVLLRDGAAGNWQLSAADQANLTVAFDQSYVTTD